jgi:hypothetical protein
MAGANESLRVVCTASRRGTKSRRLVFFLKQRQVFLVPELPFAGQVCCLIGRTA